MYIAICDDDRNSLSETAETVGRVFNEVFGKREIEVLIKCFVSPRELLSEDTVYDVVFMDIVFDNDVSDGIRAARELKQRNPDCLMLFITNYEEYIDDVIANCAFRFWTKPVKDYRLRKTAAAILDYMATVTVELYQSGQRVTLGAKSIVYITTQNRHCRIITAGGEYEAAQSYKRVKQMLPPEDFCSCHGSYCVNLNYVTGYTKDEVRLTCGGREYSVFASRRFYTAFKDKFIALGGRRV